LLSCLVVFSFLLNSLVLVGLGAACAGFLSLGTGSNGVDHSLVERYHSGKKAASDKIAVIEIEGVIFEGMLGHVERQIEQAARDEKVKAVVLRINSPGGSVTASDQLHHRILQLRDGHPAHSSGKPIVVSMASIAASGGYYIAVPGKVLYAEPTTLTGSIGVFAMFPNLAGLADKIGVDVIFVKKGQVKTSGSPFHDMTPEDLQLWQDLVDHSYDQFKAVVEQGRPQLRGKLEDKVIDEERTVTVEERVPETRQVRSRSVKVKHVRRRADGGLFTAERAREFGLVDKIGYLDDAIEEARNLAKLGEDYRAITYEKPFRLTDVLLNRFTAEAGPPLDASRVARAASPRLWYLTPQSEIAGLLSASERLPEGNR
jgi:protease-4